MALKESRPFSGRTRSEGRNFHRPALVVHVLLVGRGRTHVVWIKPVSLQGSRATLVPLAHTHADELAEGLRDGELWRLWYTHIPSPDKLADFIGQRLAAQADGTLLPFAVIDNATRKAVGMTNYLNIEPEHRRLE